MKSRALLLLLSAKTHNAMGKASKTDKPLTPGVGRQRRAANAAAADAATLPPHPKSGSDPTLTWLNGLPMIVLLWQTLRTGMNSDAEDPWRHAMWVGAVMYLVVASGSVATRHFNISKGRLHTSHRPIVLFDGGCVPMRAVSDYVPTAADDSSQSSSGDPEYTGSAFSRLAV